MLDHYSNFPPPSKEDAAKEVCAEVQKTKPGDHLELCKQVVDAIPCLGSWTGWYVTVRQEAVAEVLKKLQA